jgi:phage terminase small subunit
LNNSHGQKRLGAALSKQINQTKQEPQRRKTKRRYQIFAREYLVDLNGKRAAIAAGYSKRSADVTASRLLKKPGVQKLIRKLMKGRAEELDLTGEKVLKELARLAFANMIDYIDIGPDGSARLDFSRVDREKGAAIQEVNIEEYSERNGQTKDGEIIRRIKFKLADKGQNLERLGRHLKLFSDKVEITGLESLAESIRKARKAAGLVKS